MVVTLEAEFEPTIVERAAHGDELAFARLVAAYHSDMMRVAYVTCGSPDLAQDAVQAAWAIAWRKLATVREPDRVRHWLVAVAANEARQLVRRQHRTMVAELRVDGADAWDGHAGELIDRIDLVNALARLKPEDRMLLALRYVAGVDATELGRKVGMSPSGTRARMGRLLKRLRQELDHD